MSTPQRPDDSAPRIPAPPPEPIRTEQTNKAEWFPHGVGPSIAKGVMLAIIGLLVLIIVVALSGGGH